MANNFPNSKTVERLRKRYPEGCRVKLIQMDDIQAPSAGTCGTVSYVDDIGSILDCILCKSKKNYQKESG